MGNDNNNVQALRPVFRRAAEEMAERAGELLLREFLKPRNISFKGRIDLVTEMDRESENLIKRMVSERFPDHGVLAEETGESLGSAPFRWVIDPLDGTTNYAHGFPFFCVSVAVEEESKGTAAGAVYAPYLREMYSASSGGGATLNGEPVRVSLSSSLEESVVATGFPYNIRETGANIEYFTRFLYRARAVRRPGSAALDLCAVAAGRFDGFWELDLNPWDTAAGELIVREAGGEITRIDGSPYTPYDKTVLASNGLIHTQMLEVLKG